MPATASKRRRLSAEDWIEAALVVIREIGVDAVAVEPLAERLGVTKGSFYAHFSNRDDLVRAALDRWENEDTSHVDHVLEANNQPRAALRGLIDEMFGDYEAGKLYAGICAAGADPLVAPYAFGHALRKVDLFTDLYRRAGLTSAEAQRRAELTYTAFIGYWRIKSMFPPDEPGVLHRYIAHLERTLVPDGDR